MVEEIRPVNFEWFALYERNIKYYCLRFFTVEILI